MVGPDKRVQMPANAVITITNVVATKKKKSGHDALIRKR